MHSKHYETDDEAFPYEAYRIIGEPGIAWRILGWETEPDGDTDWTGYETRTGFVVAIMIGDDRRFRFEPDDIVPIDDDEY